MQKFVALFSVLIFLLLASSTQALYQPWIAEQEAREAYQKKAGTYSPENQKKLEDLHNQIMEINKRRTDGLAAQMEAQGMVLEEFSRRNPDDPGLERASYWLTYAHEAVAFQAAKSYIFDLSSESNIKRDVTPTVGQIKSDLTTLRKKVIDSQITIEKLVRG